jgi:hypothetical protein
MKLSQLEKPFSKLKETVNTIVYLELIHDVHVPKSLKDQCNEISKAYYRFKYGIVGKDFNHHDFKYWFNFFNGNDFRNCLKNMRSFINGRHTQTTIIHQNRFVTPVAELCDFTL